MKQLLLYFIMINLFTIHSVYSQIDNISNSPLEWFDKQRFKMVDENKDGAFSLKELQHFYTEFNYFLNDNRFFFVDLNQNGQLEWVEIYPHLNDAWSYKMEQEQISLRKLEQKHPFFSTAKIKYLKRNAALTQKLLGNYTWMSRHVLMVKKICKDQIWLKKHPLIVLQLHTNLRWLVDYPDVALIFYKLPLFNHLPPSFLSWRSEHIDYLDKRNPALTYRSTNSQQGLLRPVGPVSTPPSLANSYLYSPDPPPNWKYALDSIQIVNRALQTKDYQLTQYVTRLQSENKLLEDKVTYLTQSQRLLTTQITRERDSLLQLSRKQTSDLRSVHSTLRRSEQRRKNISSKVHTQLDSIKSFYSQLLQEKKEQDIRVENLLRENSALKSRTISPTVNEANRNQVLQRRLDQQTAEIERLRQSFTARQKMYIENLAVLKDTIKALKQKTAYPTPLPAELSLMRQSLQALQIKMASVEQEANNKITQMTDSLLMSKRKFNIQQSRYKAHISQLESQILKMERSSTKTENSIENSIQNRELKSLAQQLQVLRMENESMREQLEANSNFVASILSEKEQLEQNMDEMKSANQRLQELNDKLVQAGSSRNFVTEDSITNYKTEIANLEQLLGNKDNAYKIDKELAARRANALEEIIAEQELLIDNLEKERKISRERLVTIANKERLLEKERASVQKRAQLLKQREFIVQAKERSIAEKEQKYMDLNELENKLKLKEQQLKRKEQQKPD